jgi:tripartite-type tricarboxylate transporter receptor subunit TctC
MTLTPIKFASRKFARTKLAPKTLSPEELPPKTLPRRVFLQGALSASALAPLGRAAFADTYPSRPIHIIVGFPAGSGPDIVARILGQALSQQLNQSVVVENRPGASSNLATADVAHSAPDGYTLPIVTTANTINATLYQKLDYDFLRDITPVATIDIEPFVMEVTPAFPAKTLAKFIAYAKANPGKVTMASAGIGSAPHIYGVLFQMLAGIELQHVPYRGNPLPDLLSGQVQVFFSPVQSSLEYIRAGKLRALGATTKTRIAALPDVPAIGEVVAGYEAAGWLGVGAPAKTPPDVMGKLNAAINAGLSDATVKSRLAALGDTVSTRPLADVRPFVTADVDKWAKVIRAAKIKLEE